MVKKTKEEEKDRQVYTFTLHLEDDKELVDFLKKNGVTKNVKKGLKLLMSKQEKEDKLEAIDKEQLLLIISLLSKYQGSKLDLSQFLLNNNEEAATVEQGAIEDVSKERLTPEQEQEYEKIVASKSVSGLRL